MKKIYATSLLAFCFLFVSSALQAQNSEEKAKEITDNMKDELSLNENQYESALEINTTYIAKFEEIRNGINGRPDASTREKLKTTRNDWNTELERVLTDEQYEKHLENQKKNRKSMMRGKR